MANYCVTFKYGTDQRHSKVVSAANEVIALAKCLDDLHSRVREDTRWITSEAFSIEITFVK